MYSGGSLNIHIFSQRILGIVFSALLGVRQDHPNRRAWCFHQAHTAEWVALLSVDVNRAPIVVISHLVPRIGVTIR
jgi:hypothetical protein